MNNDLISKDIKRLLEDGIITIEEYEKIISRLEDYKSAKGETYRDLLKAYDEYLVNSNYSRNTLAKLKRVAKLYVEFVSKNETSVSCMNNIIDMTRFNAETSRQFLLMSLADKEATTMYVFLSGFKNFVQFLNKNYYAEIDEEKFSDIIIMITKKLNYDKSAIKNTENRFSKDEIYFMASLGEDTHKIAMLLCYEACMSREELAVAEFTDIDFNYDVINVKDPETEDIRRTMPLPHDLCKLLKSHREDFVELNRRYNVTRAIKGQPERPMSEYIFQSKKSNTASLPSITNRFLAIADKWHKYNYSKYDGEMSYEEFVKSSIPIQIPYIRSSKMINMIESGEWTLDDIIYKYNLGGLYYLEKKLSRFVDD